MIEIEKGMFFGTTGEHSLGNDSSVTLSVIAILVICNESTRRSSEMHNFE